MVRGKNLPPFEKIPLKDALGLNELFHKLRGWRDESPSLRRLDGRINSRANPSQYVYFYIDEFRQCDFSGIENEKKVSGLEWNGLYYLAGSVTSRSIDVFLESYERHSGDVGSIFELSYTSGKYGKSNKRRLFLKKSPDSINREWICKQLK